LTGIADKGFAAADFYRLFRALFSACTASYTYFMVNHDIFIEADRAG
jgi:hypothetical protein